MASAKRQRVDSAVLQESSELQVDSNETPATASNSVQSNAQFTESNEPLALPSSSLEGPVAGTSDSSPDEAVAFESVYDGDEEEAPISQLTQDPLFWKRVNYTADEIRSMWTWKKVFTKLCTHEQCVQFAEERGLVPTVRYCSHHRKPMAYSKNPGRVHSAGHGLFGRFKCGKASCRYSSTSYSRTLGTWFENAHLDLPNIFHLMYAFSEGQSYRWVTKHLSNENGTVLSCSTISEWYSSCRDVISTYMSAHCTQTKIGGPNRVVQIGDCKLDGKRYDKELERHIDGQWVIGMIEEGGDDFRLEVCPNNERSSEELVPLIKRHVQEGSIIHAAFNTAYECLPEHGYLLKMANQNDPDGKAATDRAHSQKIEYHWKVLKKVFRNSPKQTNFTLWLAEYVWRRNNRINRKDPFEELLKAIISVYKVK